MLIWQTVFEENAQAALVGAGLSLVGLALSDGTIKILGRLAENGGGK